MLKLVHHWTYPNLIYSPTNPKIQLVCLQKKKKERKRSHWWPFGKNTKSTSCVPFSLLRSHKSKNTLQRDSCIEHRYHQINCWGWVRMQSNKSVDCQIEIQMPNLTHQQTRTLIQPFTTFLLFCWKVKLPANIVALPSPKLESERNFLRSKE